MQYFNCIYLLLHLLIFLIFRPRFAMSGWLFYRSSFPEVFCEHFLLKIFTKKHKNTLAMEKFLTTTSATLLEKGLHCSYFLLSYTKFSEKLFYRTPRCYFSVNTRRHFKYYKTSIRRRLSTGFLLLSLRPFHSIKYIRKSDFSWSVFASAWTHRRI